LDLFEFDFVHLPPTYTSGLNKNVHQIIFAK